MYRVVILQKCLPQYRVAFFTILKEKLAAENIHLDLVYGNTDEDRKDKCKIDWATYKLNRNFKLGSLKLIWQPCIAEIRTADLVIVEQAGKLLINYVLFFNRIFRNRKFAFWGLGRNLQAGKNSPGNLFKRIFLKRCDWWFAYTPAIKSFLVKKGYTPEKITVVQNAIDTQQMTREYEDVTENDLEIFRKQYGLEKGERVLIYCGSLYKEKRLQFLVDSVDKLIEMGHKVKFIIVGAGPDEYIIKHAMKTRPHVIYTGPLFGREKAVAFKLSSLFLLPGTIGLAVLDSFVYGTPIVTTQFKYHGAEFEYLVNGYNGIITENDLLSYTKAISELLNNKDLLQQISDQSRTELRKYTIENMVGNFVNGINSFLEEKTARSHKRAEPVI